MIQLISFYYFIFINCSIFMILLLEFIWGKRRRCIKDPQFIKSIKNGLNTIYIYRMILLLSSYYKDNLKWMVLFNNQTSRIQAYKDQRKDSRVLFASCLLLGSAEVLVKSHNPFFIWLLNIESWDTAAITYIIFHLRTYLLTSSQ